MLFAKTTKPLRASASIKSPNEQAMVSFTALRFLGFYPV